MEHDFSDGFMQDISNILEFCSENNTDSVILEFNINRKILVVDMTFRVKGVSNKNG